MSDLTYEQMKVLFENLQDRLDKTAGDKLGHEELERIRDILERTQREISKSQKANKVADPRAIISEFFNQWRTQAPLRELTSATRESNRRNNNAAPTNDGNTFIERQLRQRAEAEREASGIVKNSAKSRDKEDRKAISSLQRLAGGFDAAGSKLSGFVASLQKGTLAGGLGGIVGAVAGAMDDRIDAYRTMIATGEGQFTSIQQMTNAANSANMTVTELAKSMQNSSSARNIGGANYASLLGSLTKATNTIGNMGLNFEQREEATQAYLDIAKSQGTLRAMSEGQMVNGIQSIVKSTQDSAYILGITRKEALDARKEQANDVNLATLLKARGIDGESSGIIGAAADIKTAMGDGYEKMFKQILANGQATSPEATQLAATDPEGYKLMMKFGQMARSGIKIDTNELGAAMKSYGEKNFGSDLSEFKARVAMAGYGPASFTESNAANVKTSQIRDPAEQKNKLGDDATTGLLNAEEALRASATTLREAFDTLANSVMNYFGTTIKGVILKIIDLAAIARDWIRSWQAVPETTAKFAVAVAGVIAGFTAVKVGLAVLAGILKGFGIFRNLFGGRGGAPGGGGGGGGGGGAGGGAGGAPGAGGGPGGGRPNAGRTFIQRRLDGIRNAAGMNPGAGGSMIKSVAKGVAKNGLVSALFEGLGYATGQRELSMKNLAKSGIRVAGGAAGGILGSALGPVGSFVGGTGGYMAGDWLAEKLLGADTVSQPADASKQQPNKDPNKVSGVSSTDAQGNPAPNRRVQGQPQQKSASDATGQRGKQTLTPEQMNMRIMNAQETAVNHLKALRENSETLNNLVREEIQVMRSFGERTVRLLEDTSKNTRMMADNSV